MIGNEYEQPNQICIVQFFHELKVEKDLTENSVDYAVAYEKLIHMVKYVDVIMVEYCGHKPRNVTLTSNEMAYVTLMSKVNAHQCNISHLDSIFWNLRRKFVDSVLWKFINIFQRFCLNSCQFNILSMYWFESIRQ